MPTALTRPDRPVEEVSGVGGMLKFAQPEYAYPGTAPYAWTSVILDITAWRLRHILHLAEVTHSGSYGGQKMAMTGRHWQAQIALCFNTAVGTDEWSGFLEPLLVGNQSAGYNVSVIFFLGDPVSYVDSSHNPRPSAKYYAPLALAKNIETVNDASGKDVVRMTAALEGNSKLQGWLGEGELLTPLPVF